MTVSFPQSLLQQLDVNGSPLSGWSVTFYLTGTNTVATVFKDVACLTAHPTPIQADGQGRLPPVYFLASGATLRADITLPSGQIRSIDGFYTGAAASTPTNTDPRLPVSTHSGLTTVLTAADAGKIHDITTSIGTIASALLPKGATLTAGQLVGLRNNGSGSVIVRTQGVDLLDTRVSVVMTAANESLLLVWTGAGYETVARTGKGPTRFVVINRTNTTPPTGVNAGSMYLAPTNVTGSAWSADGIYQADGVGGWIGHTPVAGDECIVTAETTVASDGTTVPVRLFYTGATWLDASKFQSQNRFVVASATTTTPPTGAANGVMYLAPTGATGGWTAGNIYTSNGNNGWSSHTPVLGDEVITRDATTTVAGGVTVPVQYYYAGGQWINLASFYSKTQTLHVRGEFASGTSSNTAYALGGSAPSVNVYTQVVLNTTVQNTIPNATVASNLVTLPTGTYRIRASHVIDGAISARLAFKSTTTTTFLKGRPLNIPASTQGVIEVGDIISVTAATETFQLMFVLAGTAAATSLGLAASIAGENEVYGALIVEAL